MVEGRMKKFTGEVSPKSGQPFVVEPECLQICLPLLKEHNADVTGFIR